MKRVLAALLLLCIFSAPASAQLFKRDPGDEIILPDEEELQLPAAPKDGNLVRFDPGFNSPMNFHVDPDSLKIGKADRIVRFTLVITSESGARNVSYEGFRCETGEKKIYAYGGSDGKWSAARDTQWKPVHGDKYRWTLFDGYFCPRRMAVSSPQEGLETILRGIHDRNFVH